MALLAAMRTAGAGSRPAMPIQAQTFKLQLVSSSLRAQRRNIRPPGTRAFAAAAALDSTVQTAQHLFTGLHHTVGLPWFLAIPAAAVVVSLATRLPLTLMAHRATRRRMLLAPLLRAWLVRYLREGFGTPKTAMKDYKKMSKQLNRHWGVQTWKAFANLAVLPGWLVVMESLRRLCGAKSILGTSVHGPARGVEVMDGNGLADTTISAMDPSLATGGFLWFPDLTVADPLHVLPTLLTSVMLLNVVPETRRQMRQFLNMDDGSPVAVTINPKIGLRAQRAAAFGAFVVGAATANLPAALHLYWISTATFTLVQRRIMKRLSPLVEVCGIRARLGGDPLLMRPRR